MDATTFIMNCFGIPQSSRAKVEETFRTTRPETIGLVLTMMGQNPGDEDFDAELDKWPLTMEITEYAPDA